MSKVDAKVKFNALSNARHIFALKEENIQVKLLEVIPSEEDTKAIAVDKEGEIIGIYTDSKSASKTMQDLISAFGDSQPFVTFKIRETAKGQSIYYAEVE